MVRFTDPWFLLLLIPFAGGLIYSFRHVHGMAKGRKRLAFVIRFILVSLMVFALAGPESRRPNRGLCTVFVLDKSDSVAEADRIQAERFIGDAYQHLGQEDQAAIIVFGKNPVVDSAPGHSRTESRILSRVDGSASDLASALRLASASFPDGKGRRIVLLSDGNETSGDVEGATQAAAADGITIDIVPLGLRPRTGEAAVVGLEAPSESRADQPFDLRIIVDSSVSQDGRVDLARDGVLIKQVPVNLGKGRNAVVVSEKLHDVGFHRYQATLFARHDTDNRNNVGLGFVAVRGKPKLLVLQTNPKETTLADSLRKNGIAVELHGPGAVPAKPEELQGYDAILFNDLNADCLTTSQMKLFQAAVRDSGIGFGMIGGENSFLPGGYYGSAIAEALPVDLNVRQRKTFPSTSILIIVDASGSMGMQEDGMTKLRLAGKAAEETVKLMSPMDRAGVAGSSDGIEFVAPMGKLTDKGHVIDQIEHLSQGGGGIYIGPTMLKAEDVLKQETTQVRHFILLADGDDSEDQAGAVETALRMRADHITTSVVAIGTGKDVEFLRRLAAAGGGRYYLADHANKLPAIFTQDTSIMSRSAIEEGAFLPKLVSGEEILRGIEGTGVPPLLAYCLTDSRPLARMGMKTQKDDPLLATWQYGLGTSLAFTSDAHPRWARNWVGWEGFGTFWSQATRAISRRATLNSYRVSLRNDGGKGVVDLKAFDSFDNPMHLPDALVKIATPHGGVRDVRMEEQAPGIYSGTFDASEIGTYIATVVENDPSGGNRTLSSGFSVAYPPEYQSFQANRPLLTRVASEGSGREIQKPEEAVRPVKNPGASITELWPILMLLSALLLPLDIAVRRLALPMGEIWAAMVARFRRNRTQTVSPQIEVVDRLKQAKNRVQTSPSPQTESAIPGDVPKRESPVTIPAATGVSTTKSLLDAKRNRKN